MNIPRIVLAGTHSGVGKTTLATGIMAVLKKRNRPIQGYKVGPDYIDPSYHTAATGRPSRNLDRWLLGENLLPVFLGSVENNWAVIEGVMGLYDGMKGRPGFGSTADIAKELSSPVVLVVDAASMSTSVAALVHGFTTFDKGVNVRAVILNRVKSASHENLLREALEPMGCKILGSIPSDGLVKLPERHLGLVPVGEKGLSEDYLRTLGDLVEKYLDIAALEKIMQEAPVLPSASKSKGSALEIHYTKDFLPKKIRLGVAQDEGFLFYYQDSLEALEKMGFEIAYFSPLHDRGLPDDLDALMIGGGFPELHLPKLSSNTQMRDSIKYFSESGRPVYAECGGFMYLGESIQDFAGQVYPMVGIIPMRSEMTGKLQGIGYREGFFLENTFLGPKGTVVRGHEFHYSKASFGMESPAYKLVRNGEILGIDGFITKNIIASYLHLNFAGHPELLKNWAEFVRRARP